MNSTEWTDKISKWLMEKDPNWCYYADWATLNEMVKSAITDKVDEQVSKLENLLNEIIDTMYEHDSSTIPPDLKRKIFVASALMR